MLRCTHGISNRATIAAAAGAGALDMSRKLRPSIVHRKARAGLPSRLFGFIRWIRWDFFLDLGSVLRKSFVRVKYRQYTGWAGQKTAMFQEALPPPLLLFLDLKIGSATPDPTLHMQKNSIGNVLKALFFPTRSRRDIRENSKAPTFPS